VKLEREQKNLKNELESLKKKQKVSAVNVDVSQPNVAATQGSKTAQATRTTSQNLSTANLDQTSPPDTELHRRHVDNLKVLNHELRAGTAHVASMQTSLRHLLNDFHGLIVSDASHANQVSPAICSIFVSYLFTSLVSCQERAVAMDSAGTFTEFILPSFPQYKDPFVALQDICDELTDIEVRYAPEFDFITWLTLALRIQRFEITMAVLAAKLISLTRSVTSEINDIEDRSASFTEAVEQATPAQTVARSAKDSKRASEERQQTLKRLTCDTFASRASYLWKSLSILFEMMELALKYLPNTVVDAILGQQHHRGSLAGTKAATSTAINSLTHNFDRVASKRSTNMATPMEDTGGSNRMRPEGNHPQRAFSRKGSVAAGLSMKRQRTNSGSDESNNAFMGSQLILSPHATPSPATKPRGRGRTSPSPTSSGFGTKTALSVHGQGDVSSRAIAFPLHRIKFESTANVNQSSSSNSSSSSKADNNLGNGGSGDGASVEYIRSVLKNFKLQPPEVFKPLDIRVHQHMDLLLQQTLNRSQSASSSSAVQGLSRDIINLKEQQAKTLRMALASFASVPQSLLGMLGEALTLLLRTFLGTKSPVRGASNSSTNNQLSAAVSCVTDESDMSTAAAARRKSTTSTSNSRPGNVDSAASTSRIGSSSAVSGKSAKPPGDRGAEYAVAVTFDALPVANQVGRRRLYGTVYCHFLTPVSV
jgi:hypothetical protein